MIEKAFYVKNRFCFNEEHDAFIRIYFGNEFCEHLIPSWEEISDILNTCRTHRRFFTFLTPMVTDQGIEKLKYLFQKLNEAPLIDDHPYEIVANDVGVIQLLNKGFSRLHPIAGRLLSKQRRDPRIALHCNAFTSGQLALLRSSQFSPLFTKYLRQKNIHRVEIDNLPQGINDASLGGKLDVSLYFPYTYLTTSRLCFFHRTDNVLLQDAYNCDNHECRTYDHFELIHRQMPKPIFLKGNTQFFIHNTLPDNLEALGVNRIVYEKDIPF